MGNLSCCLLLAKDGPEVALGDTSSKTPKTPPKGHFIPANLLITVARSLVACCLHVTFDEPDSTSA